MLTFWEYPYLPMINHITDSCQCPFIPSQNYVLLGAQLQPKTQKLCQISTNVYKCVKLENASIKPDIGNSKKVQISI